MSNAWRHSICIGCWENKNGPQPPFELNSKETETCCYCGRSHSSGIFVRDDPKEVKCQGKHGGAK